MDGGTTETAPPSHSHHFDPPLCHAPPSHLPPNVDCHVIAVTIALATLAVALFAPRRLPLLSHSPSPTSSM
jgi:hypothetical protein